MIFQELALSMSQELVSFNQVFAEPCLYRNIFDWKQVFPFIFHIVITRAKTKENIKHRQNIYDVDFLAKLANGLKAFTFSAKKLHHNFWQVPQYLFKINSRQLFFELCNL